MMYCTNCASKVSKKDEFCGDCGEPTGNRKGKTASSLVNPNSKNLGRITRCPACNYNASEFLLKCPNCGQAFWQSQEALDAYMLKSQTHGEPEVTSVQADTGGKEVGFSGVSKGLDTKWARYLAVVLLIAGFIYWPDITSWYALQTFDKNSEEYMLATEAKMTNKGLSIYISNQPRVLSKEDFRALCNATEIDELGCYYPSQQKIYVLGISQAELRGIMVETVSHEMLHAVYDQLNEEERVKIDADLNKEIIEPDKAELKTLIDSLTLGDSYELGSEVYAYLGSEARNLNPYLEAHYSEYFYDREGVVRAGELSDIELAKIKNVIDSQINQLNQYEKNIDEFDRVIATQENTLEYGYFSSSSSYNRYYNTYSANFDKRKELIGKYNELTDTVERKIDDYTELLKSLSSTEFSRYDLRSPVQSR